ncbi:MAG: PD40 domain-containing protein [Anaerolineae bacterium]|nr:PD40 domain-containing protein [Anaerolineae bacterium]
MSAKRCRFISSIVVLLVFITACAGGGTKIAVSATETATTATSVLPTPTLPHSILPGPVGRVLFTKSVDRGRGAPIDIPDIYIANADGSDQTLLIRQGQSPQWSPDGRLIAFACLREGKWDLCIVNADGSGEKRLTDDEKCEHDITWSPDGQRIAFVKVTGNLELEPNCAATEAGTKDVYVIDVNKGDSVRLTNTPGVDEYSLNWEPGRQRLLFSAYDYEAEISAMYLVNADGSGLERLVDCQEASYGQWSPDGQRILYRRTNSGLESGLYVMNINADGGVNGTEVLFLSPDPPWHFAWSPDSQSIAYNGGDGLYVIRAGTKESAYQVANLFFPFPFSWSPDGEWIVFGSKCNIYVVRRDGSLLLKLTQDYITGEDTRYCFEKPTWAPNW